MMSKRAPLRTALAGLATMSVLPVVAAAAPATAAEPAPLGIPYLVDDRAAETVTIHDGDRTVTLPESIVDNSGTKVPLPGTFHLLGTVKAGYVVLEEVGPTDPETTEGYTQLDLHLVRADGTATTYYTASSADEWLYARLSDRGGAVFVNSGFDDQSSSRLVARDGEVTRLPSRWLTVLDLPTPNRVVFPAGTGKRTKIALRDLARAKTRVLQRRAPEPFADLQADLLAWAAPKRHKNDATVHVFRRISRPAKQLWHAKFTPIVLNDAAKRVLGQATRAWKPGTPQPPYQVRRVRDGKVLGRFDPGFGVRQAVWEDNAHVLLSSTTQVARCTVGGGCETVVDLTGSESSVSLLDPVVR